ncbi:nucleoside hydrolase [Shouchella lehensis]|uniref:Uridine nucleosidase 1 n=1 Tax=Shouchella lehensis G1 TaxID=1246626 RepID=A0A060M318_9BACI|nr:nucleoside hydrolase [Shouchella lehensis]AIC96420.1 Uridine nucleosidase 1 [Shouchella lehensis G1]
MKHYVLLFCDPGIDDAMAIMLAIMHPQIELVGIVTSYGNVTKKQSTINADYILKVAGMSHIPVIPAAFRSFSAFEEVSYPEIHGVAGLGSIVPEHHFPGNRLGFDTIRSILTTYNRQLTIIELGRMTALASAFNLYENEFSQVKNVFIMGGAFFIPGNRTPVAEANVYGDSVSARFIFRFLQTTIAPLNVTSQAIITPPLIQRLTSHPTFGSTIQAILSVYIKYYQEKHPQLSGPPIHDIVPLLIMVNPSLATYVSRNIEVITMGEATGMTVIDLRPDSPIGQQKIAWTINQKQLLQDYENAMFGFYAGG